jgi:DNA-directed RNA polymerase subunit omega
MKTELIEKASEVVEDIPLLINMVSQRVRQLNNGRSPLITVVERLGAADIALTEIIEGKIVIDESGDEES